MCNVKFGFLLLYIFLFDVASSQDNVTIRTTEATTSKYGEVAKLSNYAIICKFQPNGYDCERKGKYPSFGYYYDIKMEDCKTAEYGTCPYNYNKFSTLEGCQDHCRDDGLHKIPTNMSENVYCRLQPDFGYCNDYFPMWYFDVTKSTCRGFSYSGCGGNLNKFHTIEVCTARCAGTHAVEKL